MTIGMSPKGDPSEPASAGLDISANRHTTKWSARELMGRGLWEASGFLFAWSPRQFWSWRNCLLRLFGARIGTNVRIHPTARIAVPWNISVDNNTAIGDRATLYSLGKIRIGADVTVSQGAHLCAGSHDYRYTDMPLLKCPITIGPGAWICADAFVGPGIEVGEHAIVGARAVVTKAVESWTIVAGNPSRPVKDRPPLARP
jgi:putative colanic acid biosynthesis acetyltransferase WcaF